MTSCPKLKDLRCTYPHCPCISMSSDSDINGLIREYCGDKDADVSRIIGRSRDHWLVHHRKQITKIARKKGFKVVDIASALNRHHSTICNYTNGK